MLKGVDKRATPELLHCLAMLGHGDEIAVVDANFPAYSTAAETAYKKVIELPFDSVADAVELITSLLPLDGFVPFCALRMQVDDKPEHMDEVHRDVFEILQKAKPEEGNLGSIERQEFYVRAKQAFAVIRTSERRAFGCFILRTGVVF